jgi:hypothetical protein
MVIALDSISLQIDRSFICRFIHTMLEIFGKDFEMKRMPDWLMFLETAFNAPCACPLTNSLNCTGFS